MDHGDSHSDGGELVPVERLLSQWRRPGRLRRWGHSRRYAVYPAPVTVTAVIVGVMLRGTVSAVTVTVAVTVMVAAVDVTSARRGLGHDDRVAAVVGTTVTGGLSLWSLVAGISTPLWVVAGIVAVAGVVWLGWHPGLRRRAWLRQLAADWPDIAAWAGNSHVKIHGEIEDRWPDGYTIPVRVPRGMTVGHLASNLAEWASAMRLRASALQVELDPENGWLGWFHVTEGDPHAEPSADELDPHVESCTDPILTMKYDDGKPFYLRLFHPDVGSLDTLVGGSKGSGKSSFLIRLLRPLVKAGDVAIWAGDGAGGRDLGPWRNCFDQYTTDPKQFLAMLRFLALEVERREQVMTERGWRVWRPSRLDPAILLVVDESKRFAESEYGREISDVLSGMVTRTRAVMLCLAILTQYPNNFNVLGLAIRKEAVNRFCFRTNEPDTFVLQGGQNTAALPKDKPGTGFGETYGEERGMRGRVIWTSDEDRAATIETWAGTQAMLGPESVDYVNARMAKKKEKEKGEDGEGSGDRVLEGTYTVKSVTLPAIHEPPSKRRKMGLDEAREKLREMARAAGAEGVTRVEIENETGYKRTEAREKLIVPAMEAGWLMFETRGRSTVYVLARQPAPA